MKTCKELATEIVVAIINSGMQKPDEQTKNAASRLTTEDVAPLLVKIHETLVSLDDTSECKR